jgi:hypothetical protein
MVMSTSLSQDESLRDAGALMRATNAGCRNRTGGVARVNFHGSRCCRGSRQFPRHGAQTTLVTAHINSGGGAARIPNALTSIKKYKWQ